MRVAIVHDWLTGMRGGEKVLEALFALYPQAELFTLVHKRGSVSPAIEGRTGRPFTLTGTVIVLVVCPAANVS